MKKIKNFEHINILRIITKIVLLLLIVNFGWILIPDSVPASVNIYNGLVDGRERFPFGENPDKSFNLSLFNIDAMFASHKINNDISNSNYRIFLVGDSSIWGFLQTPQETLAGLLDKRIASEHIEVFNFGYPSISVLKDALVIDHAMRYKPDLIIWFTTLEALPIEKQLSTPINENNKHKIFTLLDTYQIDQIEIEKPSSLERTFWAQRRNLYDVIRLQLYGVLWGATGIDQDYPESYRNAQRDFPEPKEKYYGLETKAQLENALALEIIEKTIIRNDTTTFILINEPILVSSGENSELQYNFYYPVWAYDAYREIINTFSAKNNIKYYDLWNIISEMEFSNSAIHLTTHGEKQLSDKIYEIIFENIGEDNFGIEKQ